MGRGVNKFGPTRLGRGVNRPGPRCRWAETSVPRSHICQSFSIVFMSASKHYVHVSLFYISICFIMSVSNRIFEV